MACRASGRVKFGRYSGLTPESLMSFASSLRRAHSTVGVFTAASAATVVPHDPAPMTATLIVDALMLVPPVKLSRDMRL